jgi:hypothetical protein
LPQRKKGKIIEAKEDKLSVLVNLLK